MELKLISEDEKLISRRIRVEVNKKVFETPTKSFELLSNKKTSPFSLLENFSSKVNGLVEFRVAFSQDEILKMDRDETQMSRFISLIRKRLEKIGNNVVLLVPVYTIKNAKISKNEIEYISSLLISLWRHEVTDVFSVPLVRELIKRKKGYIFKGLKPNFYFENFVQPFLEDIFSYNGDKLAIDMFGYIPKVSHRQIAEIVNFYLRKYSITNFTVEFNSSTPINYSPVLERLVKTVLTMEKEIKREGTLLHGLNINRGLGRKEIEKIGAKDILAFCQGITSFSFPFRPVMQELEEPIFRIFEQSDYGYYKSSKSELEVLIDKEKLLKSSNFKDIEKAINTKRVYVESDVIKEKLKERVFLNYLKSKKEIQIFLKKLQSFSSKVKSKSIELGKFFKK